VPFSSRASRLNGHAAVAALLLLLTLGALAQQPPMTPAPPPDIGIPAEELWLKLTSSSGRKKLDLVIADFSTAKTVPAATAATGRELQAVFTADLKFSLHFTFEEPDSGKRFAFSTDQRKPDLKGWATTGAQVLVAGEIAPRRSGTGMTLRLYDLEMERLIASKEFSFDSDWRWLAHGMADEVIKLLTGDEGVSRTRIIFSRAIDRETKELALVDYDGANLNQLTSSGGLKLYPDWAPDGGRVCYSSYGSTTLNTYCLELGSRRATLLSSRTGLNTTPAWSPDGRTVALSLSFEGQSEIYLMDPDGRNLRRLTVSPGIDVSPCWSPNGRQLAFVSDRTGSPQVYVINADGTSLRRLTFEGSYNTSPAWSPRGDLIAFVQRQPGGTNQVCVTNLLGDTYMRLTSGGNNEDPSWSPDGLHIVFASNRAGRSELYIMDWNGTNQRRITTTGGAYSPSWSPRLSR
jgi:TolB protein